MESAEYVARATKYCRDVVSGRITSGRLLRKACERQLADLQKKFNARSWPYYFSNWWAEDVCGFIELLPHVEGEWGNDNRIRLEPWQVFILTTIFGWRRQVSKERNDKDPRRFNTAYIEMGRGNGKSLLTSGVALYCLCCEGETGPQVKVAATTNKQARVVFKVSQDMVRMTPQLREAFQVEAMAHAIPCFSNMGNIEPINSKYSTQDGLNPHLTIIDELHAHKDRGLFDVLKSARGKRRNPLSWYITTAGHNIEGVCYEQRELVEKILDGIFPGDHYFGVIYTLDKGDDPWDERVWVKANPNLGVSVDPKEFRDYAGEAKNSPKSKIEYLVKRTNLWQQVGDAWLDVEEWRRCADPTLRLDDFEHELAWIGGDLADRVDIAALVLMFVRDGIPHVFPRFYLPEKLVDDLAHRVGAHYRVWADEGLLTLTPGDYIDHNRIERDIRFWCDNFNVVEVAMDTYGSAQMASKLNQDKITTVIVPKTAKHYTDPAKELEGLVKSGRIRHSGDPILTWMIGNCVVDRRVDGSLLPKKDKRSSINKIDGVDALLMAMARWLVQSQPKPSVYERRGMLTV